MSGRSPAGWTTTTPVGASRRGSGPAAARQGSAGLGLVGVVDDGDLGTLLRGVTPLG